ncbi:hypothetical protein D9M70_515460 [compost metagenome]
MALFLLGFAHLGLAFAAPISPADYALYALPDGSLPDFCQTGIDADGKEKPAQKHVCSACRFFWALLTPPDDTVGERLQGSLAPTAAVTAVQPPTQVHSPNSSPRGPPQTIIWL